ncbi:MAG TPA: GIY-YIG nuclease family protein [Blastocatellia bacterium]|nr:GIY-YIG nuclease family protein [Blastocatellia bacterium]
MKIRQQEGFIYVLHDQMGHYKIGRTIRLSDRIRTLKIQLPFPVEVVTAVEVPNCHECERELHAVFAGCRMNGEWFALNADDLSSLLCYLDEMSTARLAEAQELERKIEEAEACQEYLTMVEDEKWFTREYQRAAWKGTLYGTGN